MDVICERCKAEYEFDEALLGEKGTTVKCSSCGLVFRVMPANRAAGRSQLKLRYAKNGTVEALGSLRELQQRIRAGEVGIDDELGRDGFPFRPLREVPELKNFFSAGAEEKATLPPRAPGTGESRNLHAAKTVEGRLPGSPGATLGGHSNDEDPFFSASTNPPPLPNQSARAAAMRSAPPPSRSPPALREQAPTQRPAAPSARPGGSVAPSASHSPERRIPPLSKQTMLGVGPQGQQVPRAPRMPSFADPTRPPAAEPVRTVSPSQRADPRDRPWSDAGSVGQPNPHATLHGAPAPINLQRAPAPEPAAPPARGSASNERGGTLRPLYGVQPAEYEPGHEGPAAPYPGEHEHQQGPGLQDDESDADEGDASTRALIERLRADARAPAVPEGRQLYLDDDELPPERVVGGSSRLWFYVLVLLLLGGGGWYYVTRVLYAPPLREDEALAPAPANSTDQAASLEADAQVAEAAALAAAAAESVDAGAGAPLARAKAEQPETPPQAASAAAEQAPAAQAPAATDKPAQAQPEKPAAGGANQAPPPVGAGAAGAASKLERGASPRTAERAATGADPEAYAPWVSKGDQLFARGDFAGAQRAYKAALALRPSGSEANAGLGFALLSAGQTREALSYFDHAASSGYAEANIGLGDAYRKLGQPSSAIEAYQGYLERLPRGPRASYAQREIDRLKGRTGGSGAEAPGAPPASASEGYRPAGELVEPAAGSAPAPAQPSEIKP